MHWRFPNRLTGDVRPDMEGQGHWWSGQHYIKQADQWARGVMQTCLQQTQVEFTQETWCLICGVEATLTQIDWVCGTKQAGSQRTDDKGFYSKLSWNEINYCLDGAGYLIWRASWLLKRSLEMDKGWWEVLGGRLPSWSNRWNTMKG